MVKASDIKVIGHLLESRETLEKRIEAIKTTELDWYRHLEVRIGGTEVVSNQYNFHIGYSRYDERAEMQMKAATAITEVCEWFLGVELAAVNARLKKTWCGRLNRIHWCLPSCSLQSPSP